MAWLLLAVSVLFEVVGTTCMKLSDGFTRFGPLILMFVCYGISLAGIVIVLRYIELSIAYAIWSGVGTALTALVGIYLFKEPATAMKMASLALVVAGCVGLQLASGYGRPTNKEPPVSELPKTDDKPHPHVAYTRL